jgi:hypothetical protein
MIFRKDDADAGYLAYSFGMAQRELATKRIYQQRSDG